MKALICDRCGAVIRGKETENTTKVVLATEKVGAYQSYHLCDSCEDAFDLFLQEGDETNDRPENRHKHHART